MKVRIGISETNKVVEIDIDDAKAFRDEIERGVADGTVAWFTDTKGRTVGIPTRSVAFVEIESEGAEPSVGFLPGT